MKYRIKKLGNGYYRPQRKLFGLFWADYGMRDFLSLREAKEYTTFNARRNQTEKVIPFDPDEYTA